MRTHSSISLCLLVLLAPTPASAAVFAWDGGGGNDLLITGANWDTNTVPGVNDDLVFAGTTRLSPLASFNFEGNSLTFNNTAGAFLFSGSGTLGIKTGGLTNNDIQTQTFNCPVNFGLTGSSFINAASGPLVLNGAVNIGTASLTVSGAQGVQLGSPLTGTGTITKTGAGALILTSGASAIGTDFNLNAGATTLAAGAPQSFGGGSVISMGGGSLNLTEHAVLNGALLTRAGSSGSLTLTAGKSLQVQNSGGVNLGGSHGFSTASTSLITGNGSFFTTGASLNLTGGHAMSVKNGADVTAGNFLDVGASGSCSLAVDGPGSTVTAPSLSFWGSGGAANVTFSNSGSGVFGQLDMARNEAGSTANVQVLSGASVQAAGLTLAGNGGGASGTLSVDGAASTFTVTGGNSMTVGAASATVAGLNVLSGAVFTSGTGSVSINATGTLTVTDAIFEANGNTTLNGTIEVRGTGAYNIAAGRTLTMSGASRLKFLAAPDFTFTPGGPVTVTGGVISASRPIVYSHAGTLSLTGQTSALTGSGAVTFGGGVTVNVNDLAEVTVPGGDINAGTAGNGTVLVRRPSPLITPFGFRELNGELLRIGDGGSSGLVSFSDTTRGGFVQIMAGESAANSTSGTLVVSGGSEVTAVSLHIGTGTGAGASGTVRVTEDPANPFVSSLLRITGDGGGFLPPGAVSGITVGAAAGSTGLLELTGNAMVDSDHPLRVNETGTVAIGPGATLDINHNVTVNRGLVTRTGGSFLIGQDRTLRIENGGRVRFSGAGGNHVQSERASLIVSGAGSEFDLTGNLQWEGGNTLLTFLQATAGGRLSCGGSMHLGKNNTALNLDVTGAGSEIRTGANSVSEWQAFVQLRNGATATLGALRIADVDFNELASGLLLVDTGATASIGSLTLATPLDSNFGIVEVRGSGSRISQTGASTLTLGALFQSTATLSVMDGGVFETGAGDVLVNETGTIEIAGGTLRVNGLLTKKGTLNFDHGALELLGPNSLTIGTGGLLGAELTLEPDRELTVANTTTVAPFRTLTLNGGTLTTGVLDNRGTVDFRKGLLAITGTDGYTTAGGALGSQLLLGPGAEFVVSHTASISAGTSVTVDGGRFEAGTLLNAGLVDVRTGSLQPQDFTNQNGGQLFTSRTVPVFNNLTNQAGGRITLQDGTGGISGAAGSFLNQGLLNGDGTVFKAFTNATGGEVRAENGKLLDFTGPTGPNAGRLNLMGGMLSFARNAANSAAGQINGHGMLLFPSTSVPSGDNPEAGLNNSGVMNFSSGDTLVFGTVANHAGGRIIASGGASTTFFDVFRHAGAEVKASTGSALVFFGEVRGPGSFSGTGTIFMEGGFSPGASPGAVTLAPQVVFTASNTVRLEIGGRAKGTEYDTLTFTSTATPQVTWDGVLTVTLIDGYTPAAGDVFDVFDFDPTRDAGTFPTMSLPSLTAGLEWDVSLLYTDGTLKVVAEGLTFAQWAAGVLGDPAAVPDGDHDQDGLDNATEFALGLFPPQPGSVLPGGGLHAYTDGERLRLIFTRPLDRTGVTLKVQGSSDLVTWEDLAVSVDSAAFTGTGFVSEDRNHPLDAPGMVEVRDVLTTTQSGRRQIRLSVTIQP